MAGTPPAPALLLVVGLQNHNTGPIRHAAAVFAHKRTCDAARPADGGVIIALRRLAAEVVRGEQIIPAVPFDQERGFDGIGSAFGLGPRGDGDELWLSRRFASRSIHFHQLEATPETAKGKPSLAVTIHEMGRIDAIVIVLLTGLEHQPFILPMEIRGTRI